MIFSTLAALLSFLFGGPSEGSAAPKEDKIETIHLNLKSEPLTLDPRKGGDVISSHMHFLLFEGLVRLTPEGTIVPAQAKSFTISDDNREYVFEIRDTIWSDGTPVTAFDFEKSWKDILDPAFPSVNAHLLYPIKNAERAKKGLVALSEVGIEAKDEKTLVISLEKPTPYFLDLISFCVFFPVSIKNDNVHPDWAYNAGPHFVSNGPFVLKEWKHNNEIVAERNPNYWDKERVRPRQIHFSMIDNETTALQMFEKGELDVVGEPLSPLPIDALPSLKKKGQLLRYPIGGTTMITFNVNQFPFTNAKIRKAFAYAIHRSSIVKNITQLGEQVATGAIPPILKGGKQRDFFRDHDLEKAREMLDEGMKELGITKDAFKAITYFYTTSDLNHKIAQAIQQQWAEAFGIELKLENVDHKILIDKMTKRDYIVAQTLWVAQYNDQMNILERFKFKHNAKNYPNWENADYIKLLEQSFYENGEQRLATLEKAEEIFLDEMPICPIYHWDMAFMVQSHLADVDITPIGDIVFENLAYKSKWKQAR